jgi:putative CocE/NonD family hydrolase
VDDARCLTYTTAPFDVERIVTGHPVVHLWVTSTHPDGDFFVTLEEVDASGRSHYLTEGALRASHRAVGEAPFDDLGLPYHPSTEETLLPLPDHPVELVIDLMGTAAVIDAGHRLRLTVAGANRPDFEGYPDPATSGVPVIKVYRDRGRPSSLDVPMCRLTP